MPLWLSLPLVPVLILLNAFFVSAEYAVVAVRGAQIDALRQSGRRRAADAIQRLKASQGSASAASQVCITMTNLLLGWIGEPAMTSLLGAAFGSLLLFLPEHVFRVVSVALSFIIVTFLTVVLSELLPKAITLRTVVTIASLTARPVLLILGITRPLVWLMNKTANLVTVPLGLGRVDGDSTERHTADEIRLIASRAAEQGALTPRERSLILNSLSLGRRTAWQIMVPRVRIAYLDLAWSMEQNRAVVEQHLYSRMPLCNGGVDQVIGIVSTREFLAAYQAGGDTSVLQLVARPAVIRPETISLDKLLMVFDAERTQMVLLVDEHGGVEGLVTLRDVVDELVGTSAIHDATTRAIDAGTLELPGDTPLVDVARLIGREGWMESEREAATVGGLMVARLGRVPVAGDEVVADDVTLHAVECDTMTVRRVRVSAIKRHEEEA
jgi:CBS domain containing-hemolysin-like protein